jgi:hypothetical protein
MDPFSVSVGTLAIIQAAFRLTVTVSGYLRNVTDASKDQQKLLDEVVSLQAFFTMSKLKRQIQKDPALGNKIITTILGNVQGMSASPSGPLQSLAVW